VSPFIVTLDDPTGLSINPFDPNGLSINPFDPNGLSINPFDPNRSSQPYASNLAQQLDNIKNLNGGQASPADNTFLTAQDQA